MVRAAPTEDDLKASIDRAPEVFSEFIPIMTTEAASHLPRHCSYNHVIGLKESTTPP